MQNSANNAHARTIEGVLIYLNAFLMLDLLREVFGARKFLAVLIVFIMTLIAYMYLVRLPMYDAKHNPPSNSGPVMLLTPVPQNLVETFRYSRNKI